MSNFDLPNKSPLVHVCALIMICGAYFPISLMADSIINRSVLGSFMSLLASFLWGWLLFFVVFFVG